MEEKPEAAVAPEAKTEATPTNTNQEQQAPAAPDMHGFTSEQLADMQKFFQANGGYEKVKSKISNPTPAPAEEQKPAEPVKPAEPEKPAYKAPEGSITFQEFMAKEYFKSLAAEKEFAPIADEIAKGEVLKDMAALGVQPMNEDGTINDARVRYFLGIKAKTVPAKQSSAEPEASAAPTVDYVPVGEQIDSMDQAYAVLRQDSQLKSMGKAGHPSIAKAEEYIKTHLNPEKK